MLEEVGKNKEKVAGFQQTNRFNRNRKRENQSGKRSVEGRSEIA